MKCMRVVKKDPMGEVHEGCPNDAEVERMVQINNLPILLPMCLFHDAEFDREAAAYRQRRRTKDEQFRRQHGDRAAARRRG